MSTEIPQRAGALKASLGGLAGLLLRTRFRPLHLSLVEASLPARLLLRLFRHWPGWALTWIPPSGESPGSRFPLADLRDPRGQSAALSFYRELLLARERLLHEGKARRLPLAQSLRVEPGERPFWEALLDLDLAERLRDPLALVLMLGWGAPTGAPRPLVLLPRTEKGLLQPLLQDLPVQARFSGGYPWLRLAGALLRLLRLCAGRKGGGGRCSPGGRLALSWVLGASEEYRNDLPFLKTCPDLASRISFRLTYPDLRPTREETADLNARGMRLHRPFDQPEPGERDLQAGAVARAETRAVARILLAWLWRERNLRALAGLPRLERWARRLGGWRADLDAMEAGVHLQTISGPDTFVAALAQARRGGLSVVLDRSMLFYCTYVHLPAAHLGLAPGPDALAQGPVPPRCRRFLLTGPVHLEGGRQEPPWADSPGVRVITFFDENPNAVYFGSAPLTLYGLLLDLVEADERLRLVVKTKKPQVAGKFAVLDERVEPLVRAGRVVQAPWQTPAGQAARWADLVVGVPSTALYESFLAGTPTLAWDPMGSPKLLFYRNEGLNRRIFREEGPLREALTRWLDGCCGELGDCRDLLPLLDPFGDGGGAGRVGAVLRDLLEGLGAGQPAGGVLEGILARYRQAWGDDKVVDDGACRYRSGDL